MGRSLIGQIYAYIVCLLAIVVGLAALAGFVGGIFGTAHPTGRMVVSVHQLAPFGGHRGMGGHFGRRGGMTPGMPAPSAGAVAAPSAGPAAGPMGTMRAQFVAAARYEAARRMIVCLVLLLAAIWLFVTHWRWLHREPAAYRGSSP